MPDQHNADQATYWTSMAGQKWVTHESALNHSMAEILDVLLQAAKLQPGQDVLDIGCGTGDSTLKTAAQVGPSGTVTGLDISPLLLNRAKNRAKDQAVQNVKYIDADAQSHSFHKAKYDTMLSRFGMMFFADPPQALRNIATALKPNGHMLFICWSDLSKNPWFQIPRDAAIARLGQPSALDPDAPGPLAFRDIENVCKMMTEAGLAHASGRELSIDLHPPGTLEQAAALASNVGPAARVMKEFNGTADDLDAIRLTLQTAFQGFVKNGRVRVPARLNLFTARVSGQPGP